MRILVTGAGGFVGSAVCAALSARRHEVRALGRSPRRQEDGRVFRWDPETGELDPRALEGLDAVVHLAGENIAAGRWTEAFKKRIHDSRVLGTRLLVERLAALERKPALVAASAVGYYGDRGAEELTEASGPGGDFLAGLCRAWEAEAAPYAEARARVVHLRIGVVLGERGGLLRRMLLPFRLGLGGRLGPGTQYLSWITLPDLVRVFVRAAEDPAFSGAYNAVAPNPVTNAQFTASLGRAVSMPAWLRQPAFALRLAFGEKADALMLVSQRALPTRLKEAGFTWEHAFIGEALNAVTGG